MTDLLELMDMGLSGKDIADLVSSGASLHRVKDAVLKVGGPCVLAWPWRMHVHGVESCTCSVGSQLRGPHGVLCYGCT